MVKTILGLSLLLAPLVPPVAINDNNSSIELYDVLAIADLDSYPGMFGSDDVSFSGDFYYFDLYHDITILFHNVRYDGFYSTLYYDEKMVFQYGWEEDYYKYIVIAHAVIPTILYDDLSEIYYWCDLSSYADYNYDYGLDIGFSNGYDSGYEEGYDEGYSFGLSESYDFGFDEGYEEGYNVGYDTGLNESFNPWSTFTNFFNITLFGNFKLYYLFEVAIGVGLLAIIIKILFH